MKQLNMSLYSFISIGICCAMFFEYARADDENEQTDLPLHMLEQKINVQYNLITAGVTPTSNKPFFFNIHVIPPVGYDTRGHYILLKTDKKHCTLLGIDTSASIAELRDGITVPVNRVQGIIAADFGTVTIQSTDTSTACLMNISLLNSNYQFVDTQQLLLNVLPSTQTPARPSRTRKPNLALDLELQTHENGSLQDIRVLVSVADDGCSFIPDGTMELTLQSPLCYFDNEPTKTTIDVPVKENGVVVFPRTRVHANNPERACEVVMTLYDLSEEIVREEVTDIELVESGYWMHIRHFVQPKNPVAGQDFTLMLEIEAPDVKQHYEDHKVQLVADGIHCTFANKSLNSDAMGLDVLMKVVFPRLVLNPLDESSQCNIQINILNRKQSIIVSDNKVITLGTPLVPTLPFVVSISPKPINTHPFTMLVHVAGFGHAPSNVKYNIQVTVLTSHCIILNNAGRKSLTGDVNQSYDTTFSSLTLQSTNLREPCKLQLSLRNGQEAIYSEEMSITLNHSPINQETNTRHSSNRNLIVVLTVVLVIVGIMSLLFLCMIILWFSKPKKDTENCGGSKHLLYHHIEKMEHEPVCLPTDHVNTTQ